MKKIVLAFAFLTSSFFAFANETPVDADNKVRFNVSCLIDSHSSLTQGIPENAVVAMIINGELVNASVNRNWGPFSSIEVDKKYENQEITAANVSMMMRGKKYTCKAIDLPLYVQAGDPGIGTNVVFICSQ